MSGPSKPEPVFDDELDAKARKEREQEARRERARLRFRELFPKTTEFADLCREHFGDQVEVIYTMEGGKYVGPVPDDHREEYEKKFGPVRRVRLYDEDHTDGQRHAKR